MRVSYCGKNGPGSMELAVIKQELTPVDQAYKLLCQAVMANGFETSPRGMKVRELLDCSIFIPRQLSFNHRVVASGLRNVKERYLAAEMVWYLTGSRHIGMIEKYAPFWKQLADTDGRVVSNYGCELYYDKEGGEFLHPSSQFERIAEELTSDPDSRRCVANIYNKATASMNPKDVPCTLNLQFMVREGALHMSVCMRSNDLVLGWCNDVFQFMIMQEIMHRRLRVVPKFENLCLGNYHHHAGSMHVYERDFAQVLAETTDLVPRDRGLSYSTLNWKLPNFRSVDEIRSWAELLIANEKASRLQGVKFPSVREDPENIWASHDIEVSPHLNPKEKA